MRYYKPLQESVKSRPPQHPASNLDLSSLTKLLWLVWMAHYLHGHNLWCEASATMVFCSVSPMYLTMQWYIHFTHIHMQTDRTEQCIATKPFTNRLPLRKSNCNCFASVSLFFPQEGCMQNGSYGITMHLLLRSARMPVENLPWPPPFLNCISYHFLDHIHWQSDTHYSLSEA